MIRYSCAKCGEALAVDDSRAGSVYVCPLCSLATTVPKPVNPTPRSQPVVSVEPPAIEPKSAPSPAHDAQRTVYVVTPPTMPPPSVRAPGALEIGAGVGAGAGIGGCGGVGCGIVSGWLAITLIGCMFPFLLLGGCMMLGLAGLGFASSPSTSPEAPRAATPAPTPPAPAPTPVPVRTGPTEAERQTAFTNCCAVAQQCAVPGAAVNTTLSGSTIRAVVTISGLPDANSKVQAREVARQMTGSMLAQCPSGMAVSVYINTASGDQLAHYWDAR